jgi:O-antigen/teichoic acid export membrane protein
LNSAAFVLDAAARAIVGFVVTPILLLHLGDVGFGNWQVLQRLVGHANPAGGRPSEALKWFVANRQSSDDEDSKRRAVGSAIAVWLAFVPLVAIAGAVLAWFAPVWMHVPKASFATVRLAGAILVLDIILSGLGNIPWAVLQGQNLGYKRLGMTMALEFVGGGFILLAVFAGSGFVGLALADIATTILAAALFLWIVRNYVPWFGVAKPDLREVWNFMRLSGWFLLWNFVTRIMMGSDIVVLGIFGSASAATTYTLTRFIPLTITVAVTSLITAIMPGLGGLVGAGEFARAVRIRTETLSATWLISAVAGACVLLLERSFLGLWVGARYYPGPWATLLIVIMVLQLALIRVDANIIDLTLQLRWKVLLGLLGAALSVGFAWALLSLFHLGIAGLAAGFIAGRMIQTVTYPVIAGRRLGIALQTQLLGIARPALVTIALFAAAAALGVVFTIHTWVALVVAAGAAGLGCLLFAFFIGLTELQRRWVQERARRVAKMR